MDKLEDKYTPTTNTLINPLPQKQRTAIIDILRGWSLLGVVIVNYSIFYNLGIESNGHSEGGLTKTLMGTVQILFGSKSWTLLSFLFGYGFSILIKNIKAKGINHVSFFSRRMIWLFIIGLVNSSFYFGDILKDYALLGLALLIFQNVSSKNLLYFIFGLLLLDPLMNAWLVSHRTTSEFASLTDHLSMYKSYNVLSVLSFGLWGSWKIFTLPFIYNVRLIMLTCFLIGMALQKVNFLERLQENIKFIKQAFWYSWLLIVFLFVFFVIDQSLKLNIGNYYYVLNWFTLAVTTIITTSICWLYYSSRCQTFFKGLQLYGKMTLTNYISQNMIGLLLFSGFGFGLLNRLPYSYYLMIALLIYGCQIYFSRWWLSKYNFGPIEWLWRCLTYRAWLPLKKEV